MVLKTFLNIFIVPVGLLAQNAGVQGSALRDKTDLQIVLDRLDRLEQENRDLAVEVRALRSELAASRNSPMNAPAAAPPVAPSQEQSAAGASPATPPLDERVAVVEQRVEDQSQTKVESSQKFLLTLSGMTLFNAFLNGRAVGSGGTEDPTIAAETNGPAVGGATLRQSVVGLKFQGPQIFGGGLVSGSLYMDFFGGTTSSLDHLVRLRVARIDIDWKNTSVMVGQDKPLISQREPNSLAQVGVSPLTDAGNPWLWQPQTRVEQRFPLGDQSGFRAQLSLYQTSEPGYDSRGGTASATLAASLVSPSRPGLEGRFELWRKWGENARVEVAPGFHVSDSHVAGITVPSRLFTFDWMARPIQKLQFTGLLFQGQNDAGIGALPQGFTVFNPTRIVPVGALGGWGQLSYLATKRVSFNVYAGEERNNATDLLMNDIHRNLMYAGNVIYRLGPNVLLGLETSQVRTDYFLAPFKLNNHCDLAIGYLF